MEALKFISDLNSKLDDLRQVLEEALKAEERTEDAMLDSKGFLFHRYSIHGGFNDELLKRLKSQLERVEHIENEVIHSLKSHARVLKKIENDYNAYEHEGLELKSVFTHHMKEAFRMSRLAITRIDQLLEVLENDRHAYRKKGSKAAKLVHSLEKMTNQVMKFVDMVWQIEIKIGKFENTKYNPSPKTYGRVMGRRELKKSESGEVLACNKNPVPCFDCPPSTLQRLEGMSDDERKNFFKSIGVHNSGRILIFETRLKPINSTPITQTNGLREYKFPNGIHIDIKKVA